MSGFRPELPRGTVRLVDRPRLHGVMAHWREIDLAVVVAPAGYGKSTAIAQWCRLRHDADAAIAWLALDEADGDPAQFLAGLIDALAAAGIDAGGEDGAAWSGLRRAIERLAMPVIIVLDDYHRVGSVAVDAVLRAMLRDCPDNLTLVVLSRMPVPFDVAPMLASGRARELTADTLKFDAAEAADLFDQRLSPGDVARLQGRTQGWPVVVQFAKLAFESGAPGTSFDDFPGDAGHVAVYFADQVFGPLDDGLQAFLLQTALLDHFDDRLAAAITGRADAIRMMQQLEAHGLLTASAGGSCYNPLFSRFLRTEHRARLGDDAARQVHERASLWHEAHGDVADAVRHAGLSGDHDRCIRLIENAGAWEIIMLKGGAYLRGLLQHLPDTAVHHHPRIAVAEAYCAIKDGQIIQARTMFDLAASIREGEGLDDPALDRDMLNIGWLLRAYEDRPTTLAEVNRLEANLVEMASADPVTRSVLSCAILMMQLSLGCFGAADSRAQQAMRWMLRARQMLGLTYCHTHAGTVALYQGRLRASENHFSVARRMAEESCAYDPGSRAASNLLASCQRYWAGEPPLLPIEQIRADLDRIEIKDGWLDLFYAALVVESGVIQSSDATLARFRGIARARGLVRLAGLVDAFSLHSETTPDRAAVAMAVLHALPDGCWQADRYTWLVYLESRLGLAAYFAGIDRSRAIQALTDGLSCARDLGAFLHVIRKLIARAHLFHISGQRILAIDDMIEALTLAAPEGTYGPFLAHRGAVPLLRMVVRYAQETYVDILVVDFATNLLTRLTRQGEASRPVAETDLSLRERDVLEELRHGRSNKEIARLLNMTENTVKFHLKGIFSKLGVSRRIQAVARAREIGLI